MFKRILANLVVLFALLAFAGSAFAATSVRLEEPKSPTDQNTFNLTYVALDTDNNPVTVTCWKKGPSDGSYSQFGSSTTLPTNGGGSDNCPVDSSVINAQGTYSFYVIANGVQSNTVSVDYDTNGPGTPSNYSKDHPTSCEYKISFQTANDNGETVQVNLYRSENTSFTADGGSKVQTMNIGSNTSATFTDTIPDCSKTYYYALRAFDNAGNGSGVIGDSETHVTTSTTTTNGTTAAGTTTTEVGAIPVITSSVNPETSTTPAATPAEKKVLGTETSAHVTKPNGLFGFLTWSKAALFAIVILVIGIVSFWLLRKRKS